MLLQRVVALSAMSVVGITAQTTSSAATPTGDMSTTPTISGTTMTTSFSSSSTTSSGPKTTTVSVGYGGFKFTQNSIVANVGDTVEFLFFPDQHSVIRADFGYPCYPYELVNPGKTGFYSGPQLTQTLNLEEQPRYRVIINDTAPVFYYCGAPGSCVNQHMIGVINPNGTQTLALQLAALQGVEFQLVPGQPWPAESGVPSPTHGGSSLQTSTPSPTPTPSPSSGEHLGAGAIAGIAIGSAAVLVLAAALIYMCGRRGGHDRANRTSTNSYQAPPGVIEAKYSTTPKSMGTETWSNPQYSSVAPSEAYRDQTSPTYGLRSPPISPNQGSGPFAPQMGNLASPLMSSVDGQSYYQQPQYSPPPHAVPPPPPPQAPPVELPTSSDPGNSPLPTYPSRKFSWAGGAEASYRPTKN